MPVRLPKKYTSDYNQTAERNDSNFVDEKTNFVLRNITHEDIDKAVWETFHQRFKIKKRLLPLIKLDGDYIALKEENLNQVDSIKKFIGFPTFTITRTSESRQYRVSPSNRPVVYSQVKKKENGYVVEQYTTTPPRLMVMNYTLTFHSTYRGSSNEFINQWEKYFANKRAVIKFDNERFEIQPEDYDRLYDLTMENGDDNTKKTVYNHEMRIQVWCYLRDIEDVKKKELPNRVEFEIKEKTERVIGQADIKLT